jgi:hypothetical protein
LLLLRTFQEAPRRVVLRPHGLLTRPRYP